MRIEGTAGFWLVRNQQTARGDDVTKRSAHPVAELFPMLADEELQELAEDIKQRGQLHPIVLDSQGRILDGRNRHAACLLVDVEPQFVTFDGDDPDGYALAVNIARRHLTTGARAIIAAQAAQLNGHRGQTKEAYTDLYIAQPRLAEANVVLDWAPDKAAEIVAGLTPLSVAVGEARQRKQDAEHLAAKMQRLRDEAQDLAVLVDEERLPIDEAVALLDERQRLAAEQAERERREREADAEQEAAENAAAIRRIQESLVQLATGWLALEGLDKRRDYQEILLGLTPADRELVLHIQSLYVRKKAS
jgi:ParB-like chromosome segregation protein Spo0J